MNQFSLTDSMVGIIDTDIVSWSLVLEAGTDMEAKGRTRSTRSYHNNLLSQMVRSFIVIEWMHNLTFEGVLENAVDVGPKKTTDIQLTIPG